MTNDIIEILSKSRDMDGSLLQQIKKVIGINFSQLKQKHPNLAELKRYTNRLDYISVDILLARVRSIIRDNKTDISNDTQGRLLLLETLTLCVVYAYFKFRTDIVIRSLIIDLGGIYRAFGYDLGYMKSNFSNMIPYTKEQLDMLYDDSKKYRELFA